jgi:hypothetical protein
LRSLFPRPRAFDRLNSECQADGCEHVDQGITGDLLIFRFIEIRNSRLVHVKTSRGFGLRPTFFPESELDGDHPSPPQ